MHTNQVTPLLFLKHFTAVKAAEVEAQSNLTSKTSIVGRAHLAALLKFADLQFSVLMS